MVLGKTLKKFAPHLIIMATIIAVAIPTLGSHALNELSPYLALSEELAKPEAIVADRMEIVDRTYVDDDPSKGWETVTWVFKLKVTNRGDEDIILPAANVTLHYLDDTLGKGWISHKYEISAGKSKMVNLYMVMKNERITKIWFTSLILGKPLDLTAIFEPYILVDGPNDEPFLPLSMVQELEFSFPHTTRGPAPFIHSITRAPVSADQSVTISVSGSDKGTGISNRTYIYYSIDGGASWDKSLLTGGEWWDRYNYHIDEVGAPKGLLGGYYPIRSTLQEETYEGKIPGFPSGTNVLFKVYLEDYAGNYEHEKTANWVESQIYSYIVPDAGAIPKFTTEFKQIIEPSATDKFFDYIELNGVNLDNYLYLNDVNAWTMPKKLVDISDFFYLHDIDGSYCMGMLNIDTSKGYDIMTDSGISSGYLLELFGISIDDFFDYLVEHIFLPTKHDLAQQASDILEEWVIIDDIEQDITTNWKLKSYTKENEYQNDSVFLSTYVNNDTYVIANSYDDAWSNDVFSPLTVYSISPLYLGGSGDPYGVHNRFIGLRFKLNIPKDAIIDNAYLYLTAAGTEGNYNGFRSQIQIFDSVKTPAFTNPTERLSQRPRVPDLRISWRMPASLSSGQVLQSPNIAYLLQNIVSREVWQNKTGNRVFGIFIDAITGAEERAKFYSFEDTSALRPKLIVNWRAPPSSKYNQSDFDITDQRITTNTNIISVIGVWNTSDHSYGNLYNESNGDYFYGNTIILKTPQPLNQTALWITYESTGFLKEESSNILKINDESIGTKSLNWIAPGTESVGRDFSSNPIDLSKSDIITFYMDYNNYRSLNGNLLVTLTDSNGRKMSSKQIYFEETAYRAFQEITLAFNSDNFEKQLGFNFGAIHQVNFTYSGTLPVVIWLDHISAYSSRAYNVHQYFTYDLKLTRKEIYQFLFGKRVWRDNDWDWDPGIFLGIGTNFARTAEKSDFIITDWKTNSCRTVGWNFLNLVATDNGIKMVERYGLGNIRELNHHMTAANLLLENREVTFITHDEEGNLDPHTILGDRTPINFYETLCWILDTEIDEFDEKPIMKEEIYPYTQAVAISMVYIPLGAVAALATVLKVRRFRTRKKIDKIRSKYTKILTR